ncbi:MAG: hypothetical protein JSW27_24575 [Phycisphaerales bacterium]|nr:MAG: hypothetical protein JSW27_24575 [Phycisphaerales bacterium]
MSAEEMRIELEAFVNQGLEEGWCGWPTKGPLPDRKELTGVSYAPVADLGHSAVPRDWWFPIWAPAPRSRASSGDGELPHYDFVVARRFDGSGPRLSEFG